MKTTFKELIASMKYRAVIYCNIDKGFWRFTRLCDSIEIANTRANSIIKKYKVKSPNVVITEYPAK